jgi:hypothetical protein
MTMAIRVFTTEQLEEIGVPDELPGPTGPEVEGLAYELHQQQIDTRRWVSVHELVFRAPDDGKAYRVSFERGLTEEQDDTDPWNGSAMIEATEVELVPVTVQRWQPVKAAAEVTP